MQLISCPVLHAEPMEGTAGYDMLHAMWHNEGWREMKELCKKLSILGCRQGLGYTVRAVPEAQPHPCMQS